MNAIGRDDRSPENKSGQAGEREQSTEAKTAGRTQHGIYQVHCIEVPDVAVICEVMRSVNINKI